MNGLLSLAFFSAALAVVASQECTIADVVFIMDESSSIWPVPFNQQKKFIKDVINKFEIGDEATRVGLVRFSSKATLEFPMNKYFDKTALFSAVDRIEQKGGNTNTGDALRVAREEGFTERLGSRNSPTIPKLAIVITDGNSQETEITKQQAELTQGAGVTVFAIGVGKDISAQELRNIASDDNNIFAVQNYDALPSILEQLGRKACNVAPTLPPENVIAACRNKRMDIAIVLDKSLPTDAANFKSMKSLAQAMLYSFQVSEQATRTSIISYSDSSKIHNYLSFGTDRAQLYDEIDSIQQLTGKSNAESAFKSLRSVFNNRYGARSKVAKVALFITNNRIADSKVAALEAATLYSQYGVEVYVVTVGDADVQEWKSVAGGDHVISESSYEALEEQAVRNDLAESICPIQPPSQDFACGERNPADIAFVVDTQNAGKNGLSAVNSFIKDITGKFDIGPQKIQVSVVENQCNQLDGFALNSHDSKTAVLNALNFDIKSNTANSLQKLVSETFTSSKGARDRQSAKRFAVLFVDGTPGSQKEAERAAESARQSGIEIFVVGIGEKVDRAALEGLASSSNHVMMVGSYADLEGNSQYVGRITDAICKLPELSAACLEALSVVDELRVGTSDPDGQGGFVDHFRFRFQLVVQRSFRRVLSGDDVTLAMEKVFTRERIRP